VAEDLKSVYLLTGSDRPKIERALRRLRDRFESESVDLLNASDTSGADAVAACNSLGLFGGERLVIVEETERWKADDTKAVAAYAADPAPGAVLGLVAGELRKDSTLKKAVAKSGEVLVYDVDRKKIVDWVVQQFAANGVKVDRDFARSVVEAVVPGRARARPAPPRERGREALDVGRREAARVGGRARPARAVRGDAVVRAHRRVGEARRRRLCSPPPRRASSARRHRAATSRPGSSARSQGISHASRSARASLRRVTRAPRSRPA
jgi:hypothetical protein